MTAARRKCEGVTFHSLTAAHPRLSRLGDQAGQQRDRRRDLRSGKLGQQVRGGAGTWSGSRLS